MISLAPGAHVAVIDVDKETGFIRVLEYYAVDDVGRAMNKEEIEGQIIGSVLQGASQVIIEAMRYDERESHYVPQLQIVEFQQLWKLL
nr:molybdopterin cofactor-binding domain-containing protein [Saccharolobus solfataricus]